MDLLGWMRSFEEAERTYERAMGRHGLSFEDSESSPRSRRFTFGGMRGCHCENGGASIWRNWISPACLACREGKETGSLFVDLRCTKSCYFCFNVNQPHFEHFQKHRRNIVLELEQAHASGANYRCLAVTGGEPLLNEDDVIAFFRRAKELYPHCHTRLYTNGELLNDRNPERLAESGLAEIRFSVKPRDFDSRQEHVLHAMEKAVAALPNVVIEMPVIPGSADEMKSLMRLGVHYCSADNRNSAQVSLQNAPFAHSEDVRRHYAWLAFGEGDHFLKCAKAFGDDAERVRKGADAKESVPYDFDGSAERIAFPLKLAQEAREALPGID